MLPSRAGLTALATTLELGRFTGREQLRTDIDTAITALRRGYVVVQAEAGVGKTALAAHLVWTRHPAAFHFTWLPMGRSPERARRSLAAQLILGWHLHDELLAPGARFPARADDPAWLVDVLAAAAARRDHTAPGQPLVLVVDSLDEAEPASPGADTGIPLGLPRPEHLPDGVVIVATTRFGVALPALSRSTSWQPILVQRADNLQDMHRYLTARTRGPDADPELTAALDRHGVDPARFTDALAIAAPGCGSTCVTSSTTSAPAPAHPPMSRPARGPGRLLPGTDPPLADPEHLAQPRAAPAGHPRRSRRPGHRRPHRAPRRDQQRSRRHRRWRRCCQRCRGGGVAGSAPARVSRPHP
jgi:hypothetical protein